MTHFLDAWQVVELINKPRFAWFGWYEDTYRLDGEAALVALLALTCSLVWIIVSLVRRKSWAAFSSLSIARSCLIGFGGTVLVIASVASLSAKALNLQPKIDELPEALKENPSPEPDPNDQSTRICD